MIDAAAVAVAYIAGRLTTGRDTGGVLDRTSGVGAALGGDVAADRVSVYDQTSGGWVVGRSHDDGSLWLFVQATMRYLTLRVDRPGSFTGTDEATGHVFDVLVQAHGGVELLDYETGSWRRYAPAAARVPVG